MQTLARRLHKGRRRQPTTHVNPPIAVMHRYAPELSRFWLPDTTGPDERDVAAAIDEDTRRREREALAELAERVSAARSIV